MCMLVQIEHCLNIHTSSCYIGLLRLLYMHRCYSEASRTLALSANSNLISEMDEQHILVGGGVSDDTKTVDG